MAAITIACSRPFVALGAGLARRGHAVELLYTEIGDRRYEALAASLGFTARAVGMPIVADANEVLRLGSRVVEARDPLTPGRLIDRYFFQPVVAPIYDAAVDLCHRSDLVIGHFFLYPLRAAAEQAGRREISVTFAHTLVPSRHIHPMGMPNFGEWGNILGWRLAHLALNWTMLSTVNRFRARLGLPGLADIMDDAWSSHVLNLVTVSPAICPRPADWPAWHKVCGFLELPATGHEQVAAETERFLAGGPAPVFMGFGSLMPSDSAHLTDTLRVMHEGARRAGCRAIIQADIDRPADFDDPAIHFTRRAPHAQLFTRCAAVVHHAGAGTTHTVLRAGVPSIPVPHVSDQFSWAEDLQRLGVAPRPLPRRRFTPAALATRITAVLRDAAMRHAAAAIREQMRGEDGVTAAVDLIDAHAGWNKT